MKNPPFRSPRKKVGGLFHFGRMVDKIRLNLTGERSPLGLDGHCCGFLNVEYPDLVEKVKQGGTDEEILEWCFSRGLRPNKIQTRIWNTFASKFGWNDHATSYLARTRQEEGLESRNDLNTAFDTIDFTEGREPGNSHD